MKSMAIISSYSDSCGNAAFTKVIKQSVEKYCDFNVEVLKLDLKLTQSVDPKVRKAADQHIKNLCLALGSFDLVNIQFEAGLFGTIPSDILKRISWLATSNKKVSVTFHSPRLMFNASDKRAAIKLILIGHPLQGFKTYLNTLYSNNHVRLNNKIIKYFINHDIPIIVHTLRAKNQISLLFGYSKVYVHPLKFIESNYVQNFEDALTKKSKLGMIKGNINIAIFGYISEYKGHSDAIRALKILPDKYKLLIYGRQHPQTIKSDGKTDPYLIKLQKLILHLHLTNRVYFMGELDDDEFIKAVKEADITWLPYYENGQDGSGIASICFDAASRVICSASFAFDELFKLIKYNNVNRVDIGNYIELANRTIQFMDKELDNNDQFNNNLTFNLKSQANLYASF